MKIVPTPIQQHIDRVDRQRSLGIGISCGLLAFWSVYRVIWSLYLTMTYNFLFGSLVFQIVLWGVIGAAAGIAATGFLTHYTKTPAIATNDSAHDTTEGKTI
jgi:hypothetical protein